MPAIDEFAGRSLGAAFADCATRKPDARLLVSSGGRDQAYRLDELAGQARQLAGALRETGITRGDVVALQLPAWSEWLVAASAIAMLGGVILPIVMIYKEKELGFILGQARARAIVTPDAWRGADCVAPVRQARLPSAMQHHLVVGENAPAGTLAWNELLCVKPIGAVARQSPDEQATLVYTSGTSSEPKGVRHSSRTLLSEVWSVVASEHARPDDTFLSIWPPGHVAGITPLFAYLASGRRLVLQDAWNAQEAARLIEQEKITSATFAPVHLSGILDVAERDGVDLSSLRDCSVGAAPVSPALIERCTAHGLRIYRRYGSTEHPSVTSGCSDDPLSKRLATEGRLLPGNELRLVGDDGEDVLPGGEGEIVTRGPELFKGYQDPARDAEAFLPGGWYRTGDVGRVDEDGYLVLTDRKKDLIIRGGENISSREVEDVLLAHPDIAEAAVVAAPDERLGEVVRACIVVRPGANVTLEAIRAHFSKAGVAKQKTPEQLVCLADLPRNATGKILKRQLRDAAFAGE